MSKILIASIGNGIYNKEKKRSEYAETEYCIENKAVKSAYIFDALKTFHDYDKLILVGTAGSNWELLYEYLIDKNDMDPDFDYIDELSVLEKTGDRKDLDVRTVREKLEKLKDAFLGYCAEIIVLKYGLNDDEHLANFELLTKIGEYIHDGDSLTFDITHSFRSLAVYELLAVSYIKEMLGRKVTLDFVSYGMFEISRDNGGKTPIVDLSILVKMTDWLKAAEEYRRGGTTALLAELMERDSLGIDLRKEERKALRRLGGDAISTNDLGEFKSLVKNCVNVTKPIDGVFRKNIALDFIFRDIARRFGDKLEDDMLLQSELAKWHFEKKRYIAAAITIVEAILDYCSKKSALSTDTVRKRIVCLRSENAEVRRFLISYNKVRKLRNKLSHAERLSEKELEDLQNLLNEFYSMYRSSFMNSPDNEKLLATALQGAHEEQTGDDVDGD
jgi:CRISPR-associated Csx2 family protein